MVDSLEKIFYKHEERLIKIALMAILILGAVLFFVGFDYELPILELDEGALLRVTFNQRDLLESVSIPNYPPIIISTLYISQYWVEWYTHESALFHPAEVIALLRLLNVGINFLTLIFVYLFASQLGNRYSGLLAAFAFAIMPEVFEHIRLALTESWQILFITISAYAMLRGLKRKDAGLLMVCTASGLLAVCAKYSAFPILGLGMGAGLWLIWQDNRKWWRILALQSLLILVTAYFLMYRYGAINYMAVTSGEMGQLKNNGFANLMNLRLVWVSFIQALLALNFSPFWYLVLLSFGSCIYMYQQKNEQRTAWLLLLIFAISFTWLVPGYLFYISARDRYVIPPSPVWIALASVSITYIGQYIANRFKQFWLSIGIIGLLSILWLNPVVIKRLNIVDNFSRNNTLVGLSKWSETSLPTGTIALDNSNWMVFDPLWGGYTHSTRTWVNRADWLDRPMSEWVENYVFYVQYSGPYPGDNPEFLFGQDELVHLKSFPIPSENNKWSGPALHIYRLLPIETELGISFNEKINLRGYDLSTNSLASGESLTWTPYWSINQKPENVYQVFLHFVPMDNFDVVAQADGTPALATRPTNTWDDPDETIIGNTFTISLPETLEAGEYRLITGLYDLDTLARLTTNEALDYVVIDTITVNP